MDTTNAISGMPLSMKLYIGAFIAAGIFGLAYNHEIIASYSLLIDGIANGNMREQVLTIATLFLLKTDVVFRTALVLGMIALAGFGRMRRACSHLDNI